MNKTQSRSVVRSVLLLLFMLAASVPVGGLIPPQDASAAPISFVRKSGIFSAPANAVPTSIALGPDGRLYVATISGKIFALTLNGNYDVTAVETINTIFNTPNFNDDGAPASVSGRMALGITFDPASSAAAPIMYVSHSDPRFGFAYDEPALAIDTKSGTITRLVGPNFDSAANRTDVVTGLPRSRKNHGTNDITFGPDGWLYIGQGGNTSLGVEHPIWTDLPEQYLSAAVVRANVRTLNSTADVTDVDSAADLQTFAGEVELYATGLRNPYDMVWHSNGNLYLNDNGSNPDQGTTPGPAHGCPNGQELNPSNQPDKFFRVTSGMYGGHPNPSRGECILDGGTMYSPPRAPEPDYVPPLHFYDYWGGAVSVDGIDEYPTGAMAGELISATFSGDKLLRRNVLNGNSVSVFKMTEEGPFNNPVDVAINDAGVIFVAEYGLGGSPGVSALVPSGVVNEDVDVTGINPTSGPTDGGTAVTISGTNFASGASVVFDGILASNVSVVNSSTITATTPAHSESTVSITVTNLDGESDTLPNAFTYTDGTASSLVRVNSAGGNYTDSGGNLWSADTGFTGGGTFVTSNSISGTSDPTLYRTERYGNFSYNFDLENGDYLVTLKFAEIYWTSAGQRVFDVAINGQMALDNFDILSETSARTALDKVLPATVTNGTLNISFTGVQDNAKISAIEIASTGGGDTTPPSVNTTSPANGAVDVPVETNVSVTFSEAMNQTSAQNAFSISPEPPPGTFSWNGAGTVMTFSPFLAVRAFDPDREYTVTIAPTAADLAGNAMSDPHSWIFTTASNDDPDTTPPTVTADPAGGTYSETQSVTLTANEVSTIHYTTNGSTPTESSTVYSEPIEISATTTLKFFGVDTADNASNVVTENYIIEIVEPAPDLTGVNPNSGSITGGTSVTLSGSNFASGATVSFGGSQATNVNVVNGSSITAVTPAHSAGSVSVTVSNPDGQSDTLSNAFTYTDDSGTSLIRINSAGGNYNGSGGVLWSADNGFSGGGTYVTGSTVSGTSDSTLYRTERYGNFSYAFSMANGNYNVKLKFAEIYWTSAGQRVFDVAINGQLVLDNFDILSETTRLTALDKSFPASVTNGTLTITFTTVVNNAKISAIEIASTGGGDTTPPSVNTTSPANGAVEVPVDSTISMTFSEVMNQTTAQSAFSINPAIDGSFSWNGAGTVMTFTPSTQLLDDQVYAVQVSTGATDLAGNALSSTASWSFTTEDNADVTPPSVTGTNPANGAVDVAVGASLSVTFSEAMNQTSAQNAFGITPSVAGSFSWNGAGTVMTFNPNADLDEDTQYSASVGTGATDLAGNNLNSAANWSFTTVDGGDTPPPSVNSTSPANGAVDVAVGSNVSVTFSEAMNQASAQAAFEITPATAGAFSWNGAGTTMTFNPSADLDDDTLYSVSVATSATDLAGNNLNSAANWSFRTVEGGDTTPPTVSGRNPSNGAVDVAVNATISVTFSEAMNQTSAQNAFSIAPNTNGSFSWNGAGTVMTFTPSSNLQHDQLYSVGVGTGAADLAGNNLGSAENWSFTTVDPPPPAAPDLTGINPTTGSVSGGTSVTLSGSNFASGATVSFGGTAATNVTFVSSTTLTATTPARSAGTVSVSVTNPGGQSDTLSNAFTYIENTGTSLVRVNSAGGNYTGSGGVLWSADNGFTGGGTYVTGNSISGTSDPTLYRTERWGNFSYNFSLANGDYLVKLKFAEIYWTSAGQRVFDVAINGQLVLDNFDILTETSPRTALDKTFPTTVTNGTLTITFTTVVNNSKVSAIEITSTGGGGGDDTTPPILTATPSGGTYSSAQNVTLSANEAATIYYTTNGSTPTTSSSEYSSPIAISATTTLKYFGVDTAGNTSNVVTQEYVIQTASPTLTLTGVDPASGPTAGGTQVTLTGTNFASNTLASFGGTLATNITVVNSTTMTATTPAHSAGPVTVAVGTAGGQIATLANGFTFTDSPPGEGEGEWVVMPAMPEARGEVAVVEAGGKVYAIGGRGPSGLSNSVYVFDPSTGLWTTAAPYPGPALDHIGAASVNGTVYIIGGLLSWPSSAVNTVYAYNPATNTWTQRANLPRDRGAMGVAVMGGEIYAVGGLIDGGTAVGDLTVYDPQSNTWTELEPMPTPRDHLVAEAADGMIFAIGGRPVDINSPRAVNEAYDPSTDSWETRAPMPTARAGLGSGVLDGKVIAFGGEGNQSAPSGTFSQTQAYDPATDSWESLAPMITARHGTNGAVVNGTIYVPGGGVNQGGSISSVHEAFSLIAEQSMVVAHTAIAVFGLLAGWLVFGSSWRVYRFFARERR